MAERNKILDERNALIHKWNALVNKTKAERAERIAEVKAHKYAEAQHCKLKDKYDDLLKEYKLVTAGMD